MIFERDFSWDLFGCRMLIPSGKRSQFAIEHGPGNSWFTNLTMMIFHSKTLVYQRLDFLKGKWSAKGGHSTWFETFYADFLWRSEMWLKPLVDDFSFRSTVHLFFFEMITMILRRCGTRRLRVPAVRCDITVIPAEWNSDGSRYIKPDETGLMTIHDHSAIHHGIGVLRCQTASFFWGRKRPKKDTGCRGWSSWKFKL